MNEGCLRMWRHPFCLFYANQKWIELGNYVMEVCFYVIVRYFYMMKGIFYVIMLSFYVMVFLLETFLLTYQTQK